MRFAAAGALLIALATGGCSQANWLRPPASAYRHFGDRLRVYFSPFLGPPCGVTYEFAQKDRLPVDRCYSFGPDKRFQGVLQRDAFGAYFYPDTTSPPENPSLPAPIAVSVRYYLPLVERNRSGMPSSSEWMNSRYYHIEFTGRELRQKPPSPSQNIVLIESLRVIRRLQRAD